jgi:hypothetical protein
MPGPSGNLLLLSVSPLIGAADREVKKKMALSRA